MTCPACGGTLQPILVKEFAGWHICQGCKASAPMSFWQAIYRRINNEPESTT